jgi:threonine dehydrogenase-like Zn-dependent dehydrogenase
MWAYRLAAPGRLTRVEAPEPPADLREGDVLLRTRAGGMCGSDIPKFTCTNSASSRGGRVTDFPGPVGYPMHEVVGEVVASRHPGVRVGADVVGWARDSTALAEFVVTDGAQVHPFAATPDPVTAVLVQPLACVLYALRGLDVRGLRVAVLGLGPIGLLFAHELARAGAGRITGVDAVDRGDLAAFFGIDDVVHATAAAWSASLAEAERPDLVVEAIGHQTATLQHAIDGCAAEGTVLYFGIPDQDIYPLDMEGMVRRNLTLKAGVTRDRAAMLALADKHLAEDLPAYRALVTDVLPFDRAQEAFARAAKPRPGQAKIVLLDGA